MEVACPACHSKNTQRIIAPTTEGIPHDEDSTTGVHSEATSSIDETALIHTSPEPKLKTDGSPITGTLVLAIAGGWLPAWAVYVQTGKLLSAALVFATTLCVIYVLIKKNIERNRHYNEHVYPQERNKWENGFYCHDCKNIFALNVRQV